MDRGALKSISGDNDEKSIRMVCPDTAGGSEHRRFRAGVRRGPAGLETGGFRVFRCFRLDHNRPSAVRQSATIVALALGINPLLDMFETACNVAGDNVGTYIISKRLKMIEVPPGKE